MKPSGSGVDVGSGVAAGFEGPEGVEGGCRDGGGCETGITGVGWQHVHLDVPFGFLVLNGEAGQPAGCG